MREPARIHKRMAFDRCSQAGKDPLTLALSPFLGGEGFVVGSLRSELRVEDSRTDGVRSQTRGKSLGCLKARPKVCFACQNEALIPSLAVSYRSQLEMMGRIP
jgi:hypothetical protein